MDKVRNKLGCKGCNFEPFLAKFKNERSFRNIVIVWAE